MSYGWSLVLGTMFLITWFVLHLVALNALLTGRSQLYRVMWGISLLIMIGVDMTVIATTIDANCGTGCR